MILMTATVGFYWLRQDQTAVAEVEQKVLRLTDGTNVSDATISPDGKYFAYVEIEGDRERVWLQQTGQSTRIEIVPWTERTHRLSTFSPDGQWVYFVTGLETGSGTLCRVSIFGGPQATVASAVNSYPSFSPDGRQMVFYRQNKQTGENTYVILSSDGSGTERILRSWQDKSPQFGNPAWSPDGKLIAFGAISLDEDLVGSCTLTSIDVESGATSSISDERWDTCYRIAWHPDGKGIYFIGTREDEGYTTRRDQLYYVSYPEGKSRCITSEGNRHQPNSIGVTNDGAVLALPFNRSSQIWVIDSDGDSRTAVQLTTGLADGRAGIAPLEDGRVGYIARSGAGLSVWIMGPDGSQQRQLTVTPEVVEELRAGGGDRLVFSARQGRRSHLFQINTDGSDLRQLAFGEGEEIDSSISSDGKWIVYGSNSYGPGEIRKSLVKRALDQGEPVQLRRGGCETPHFSPDDQFISCIDNDKLVILSSSDGAFIRSFPARPSNSLNVGARWTPDGRALAYIAVESDVGNLWLQPIDGSPPRKLTDFTAGAIYNFAYSRDRHRLFLARGNQIRDVVLIREKMQLKKP
jgi:Tol biopolymer transport system component